MSRVETIRTLCQEKDRNLNAKQILEIINTNDLSRFTRTGRVKSKYK